MLLQRNTQTGAVEYFAISDLLVDREAGVAQVTLGRWMSIVEASLRKAPGATHEIEVHFGNWTPELATEMLSLIATLPDFSDSILIEE